jgi:hypothetical protein
MTVWGVYTQFEPTYKYPEALQNLWSTKEKAIEAAKKETGYEHVWIEELPLDSDCLFEEDLGFEMVKSPRMEKSK